MRLVPLSRRALMSWERSSSQCKLSCEFIPSVQYANINVPYDTFSDEFVGIILEWFLSSSHCLLCVFFCLFVFFLSVQICLWWSCCQRSYPASWRDASSHCANGLFLGASEWSVWAVWIKSLATTWRHNWNKSCCFKMRWMDPIEYTEWSVSFFLFCLPCRSWV